MVGRDEVSDVGAVYGRRDARIYWDGANPLDDETGPVQGVVERHRDHHTIFSLFRAGLANLCTAAGVKLSLNGRS